MSPGLTIEEKVEAGRNSPIPMEEELDEIRTELRKMSNRLDVALAEGDNPVSAKCSAVLSETPRCYDFSGSRRFSACRAWEIMETEKVSWQEAITRAWKELKEKCVWD